VDPGARHDDSLMIGWTAEHMELTDGDGRTNRLRYRWNRVRWANPDGHLARTEPPGPPRRARPDQPLCARDLRSLRWVVRKDSQ